MYCHMINGPEAYLQSSILELKYALECGSLADVNRLLSIPEVQAHAADGDNKLLHKAVLNGDLEIVNRLLEIDVVLVTIQNNDFAQYDILLSAIKKGRFEIVERFLEIEGVVNRANSYTIKLAAQYGHLKIFNRLLEIPQLEEELLAENQLANADTAFFSALRNGHSNIVRRFFEFPNMLALFEGNDYNQLQKAVILGDLPEVDRLLRIPDVTNLAAGDITILYFAALSDNLEIVNRILSEPSIVAYACSIAGAHNLPLIGAAQNGRLEIVKRLLEFSTIRSRAAGSVFSDCPTNYILKLASKNGHLEVVNELLKIPGVYAKAASSSDQFHMLSRSALFEATINGHYDVVDRLLQVPAVLSTVTKEIHRSALVGAFKSGSLEVVNRYFQITSEQIDAAKRLTSLIYRHTVSFRLPPVSPLEFFSQIDEYNLIHHFKTLLCHLSRQFPIKDINDLAGYKIGESRDDPPTYVLELLKTMRNIMIDRNIDYVNYLSETEKSVLYDFNPIRQISLFQSLFSAADLHSETRPLEPKIGNNGSHFTNFPTLKEWLTGLGVSTTLALISYLMSPASMFAFSYLTGGLLIAGCAAGIGLMKLYNHLTERPNNQPNNKVEDKASANAEFGSSLKTGNTATYLPSFHAEVENQCSVAVEAAVSTEPTNELRCGAN